jgi:hypothetical protein
VLRLKLYDSAIKLIEFTSPSIPELEKSCRKLDFRLAARLGLLIDTVFKDFHCIDKSAISNHYNHINGIEVFLAVEAPCQVRFEIDGRMKIVAKRASELERFVGVSNLKIQQINNNLIDGDVIT